MANAREIDLHTHAFMRNTSGLTSEDMVQASLQRMRDELDRAITRGEQEVRFIHGVGSGSLKERVYQELRVYEKDSLIAAFEPAFFNKGVVRVIIRF